MSGFRLLERRGGFFQARLADSPRPIPESTVGVARRHDHGNRVPDGSFFSTRNCACSCRALSLIPIRPKCPLAPEACSVAASIPLPSSLMSSENDCL